jgi:hypothetical protein
MKGKRRKTNDGETRADCTHRQSDPPKTSNVIPWYRTRSEKPVKMISKTPNTEDVSVVVDFMIQNGNLTGYIRDYKRSVQ